MFEKVESYSYPKIDAKALHAHAFQWWNGAGFRVQEVGPGVFNATSASKWGLRREAEVSVLDQNGTTIIRLRMKANVTTEGVIGGGAALILLWPVAVVGGAYSYAKYEQDARDLMTAFWTTMANEARVSPVDHKEEVIATTAVAQEDVQAEAQPPVAETMLTKEDKLNLLEDRLAKGEISEDTYNAIKSRLDE
jgi:hypothetical protein